MERTKKDEGGKKEKRVAFFPPDVQTHVRLDTLCPRLTPSLPLSAHPSINHPSMLVARGIMAYSVVSLAN